MHVGYDLQEPSYSTIFPPPLVFVVQLAFTLIPVHWTAVSSFQHQETMDASTLQHWLTYFIL